MAKKYVFDRRGMERAIRVIRIVEKQGATKDLTRGNFGGDNPPSKSVVTVKVTAACEGSGKWEGIVQTGGVTPDEATWNTEPLADDLEDEGFAPPDDKNGEPITESTCYIVSLHGAALEVGKYYSCIRIGTEPPTDPKLSGRPVFNALAGGDQSILVKVTGAKAGGGFYTGKEWKRRTLTPIPEGEDPTANDITGASNLTEADIGETGRDVIIMNVSEVGQSTHDLASTAYLPLIFVGMIRQVNSDGTLVVAVDGRQWENCS